MNAKALGMRISSRYLLWTAISLAAVAGAALYFRPDPLAGCRAHPTPECLGDAALLTVDANLNSYRARETAINLASAGQFGRANDLLELRPQESASDLQHLEQSLAIWRSLWLAREIGLTERSLTPIEKLESSGLRPERVAGAYYLLSLAHLGRDPYGGRCAPGQSAFAPKEPSADRLALVALIAKRMEEQLRKLPILEEGSSRNPLDTGLWDLLKILAAIDATAQAREVLDWYGRLPFYATVEIVELFPLDEAEAMFRPRERGKEFLYLARKQLELGRPEEEALETLQTAFRFAKVNKVGLGVGYPDDDLQREIVGDVAALGFSAEAERLADEMTEQAEADTRVFRWFGHLTAAQTYLDLGLEAKARSRLDAALALIPDSENKVLAVGLNFGPYTMKRGIGAETHVELALIYWRLGEMKLFQQSIDYVEESQDARGWRLKVGRLTRPEDLTKMIATAPEEMRGGLMALAMRQAMDRDDTAAMAELTRDALASGLQLGYFGYQLVANHARKTGDQALLERALRGLVDAALDGDAYLMSRAAAHWATCAPDISLAERSSN